MNYVHLYEKIPLGTAGLCMGAALVLAHLAALIWPRGVQGLLAKACASERAGQVLLTIDFIWIALLLWDSPSNPLRMELFDFEMARRYLLWVCPVMCISLCVYSKQNLIGRAVGLFLLLLGTVFLSAAFLKAPSTRILIPLWWYPVLTVALLWVPMPYLMRDWVDKLGRHLTLMRALAVCGLVYGAALFLCALLYW